MAEYTRPTLYPEQLEAIFCEERYGLIEASTKSGKTVGSMAWIIEQAMMGQEGWNYWWVSPGYNQSDIAYRRIKQGLTKGAFHATDTPTPRLKVMSGATIWFKSGDSADALYGEDVYAAVMDEASRIKEDCWHAVRSTLTATNGPIRIIGNVKGRKNWFYSLARMAETEMRDQPDSSKRRMHYSKITAVDAIRAGVTKQEEVDDAKAVLPENIFKELYFAEPSDDAGNPFGLDHIRACATKTLATGPAVAFGIDLAKSQDYFVVIGLNALGQVCLFERWNGVPWSVSIAKARAFVGEDIPALVDSTGLGDPVLEQLQYERSNFAGYHFSSTSKQKLMEGLSVAIQSHTITFPSGPIAYELEIFEYEFTRTGVRYSAPEGSHDDCVMALALARQMWTEVANTDGVMEYYKQIAAKVKVADEKQMIIDDNDNRPWQIVKPSVITIENELEQIYNEGMAQAGLESSVKTCQGCGLPVLGPSRASDGVNVWHVGCTGYKQKALAA